MQGKSTAFLFVLIAFVFCSAQLAHAGSPAAAIKPQILQAFLKSAGIESELTNSSDTEFPRSLYIPNLKGSAVTIDFPEAGLLQGKSFSIEIDGMTALVTFTREKKLEVVAGDSRIETIGAFATVSCIVSSVFDMVEGILQNVSKLNILGIIVAVFTGVINIIGCL